MIRLVATVLMATFLSACAASGSIQTLSRDVPTVDSTKSGAVEVTTSLPNKSETVAAFRAAVAAQIINKRVFKSVANGDSSDYMLRINLTEVSEVTQAARILLGALAGQAEITAHCVVVERGGKVIGSMVAKGTSSGGHVFAGTTQEAIDMAATQIVDYLLSNRRL